MLARAEASGLPLEKLNPVSVPCSRLCALSSSGRTPKTECAVFARSRAVACSFPIQGGNGGSTPPSAAEVRAEVCGLPCNDHPLTSTCSASCYATSSSVGRAKVFAQAISAAQSLPSNGPENGRYLELWVAGSSPVWLPEARAEVARLSNNSIRFESGTGGSNAARLDPMAGRSVRRAESKNAHRITCSTSFASEAAA